MVSIDSATEDAQLLGTEDTFYGADMPAQASRWAQLTIERHLSAALAAHIAQIPVDLLERPLPSLAEFDVPALWGDLEAWAPVAADAGELDQLIIPLAE